MITIRRFFVSAVLACLLHAKAEQLSSDQGPSPGRRTVIETVFSNTERKLEDELPKRVLDSTTIGAQASSSRRSAALTRSGRQLQIRVWRLPDPPPSSPPMLPNEPPTAPPAPYLPALPRPPRPPPRPQLRPPPPPVRLRTPLAPLPTPPPPSPTPPPPPALIPPKRPSPTTPPSVRASPQPPRRPSPPPPAPSPPRPSTPGENIIGPTSELNDVTAADFAGGNCSDISTLVSNSNMYRGWHQSPPLAWSSTIAAEAQAYAEVLAAQQCELEHAGMGGECLYGAEMYPKPDWSCKRAIDAWYSEEKLYDFTVSNPYDYNIPRGTGHFAQLVWANSSVFGCGVGKADVPMSRMPGGYGGCKVVVCRYKSSIKASNVAFLQNVFPPKGTTVKK
ncbi:hypothetical protein Vafri_9974 [Volvox africanus]|uniref:SCP domain-containing protein n=1 Tax=Volvox africanus TaxID=51714 RepID=A0A8J4EZE8_9CHLO|nr:hypothetical protein Vafri_9974 [Volvox africanus]